MQCYFLRHGLAGDRQDWTGPDFERPLTDEGTRRMKREAKAIAALDLELDAIVTSPLVRAKQTAEIVAKALGLRKVLSEDQRLDPGFDLTRLRNVLTDFASAQAIMLVGHDPSMSETLGELIGGGQIDLKKGSLACVDIADPSARGTLVFLIPPKVLGGPRARERA